MACAITYAVTYAITYAIYCTSPLNSIFVSVGWKELPCWISENPAEMFKFGLLILPGRET